MTLTKRVLVLWDIDHTLIENSGVSKETYALAFAKLTGQMPRVQPSTDGRTDRQIMRNLFAENDCDLTMDYEAQLFDALIEAGQQLTGALLERGYVLPGVAGALNRLGGEPSVLQSVLTGNIRANAENKLRLLGNSISLLDLDVGGYGSDDVVRSRLVHVAQVKAKDKYGTTFGGSSTILIGDTERDVWAAQEGGAKIVGVATGEASEERLRGVGADAVLPDLTDIEALLAALTAITGEPLAGRP